MTALGTLTIVSAGGLAVGLILLARNWRALVELQYLLSGIDVAGRHASRHRPRFAPPLSLPDSVRHSIGSATQLLVLSESCEECQGIADQLDNFIPRERDSLLVGIRGAAEDGSERVRDQLAGSWNMLPRDVTEAAVDAVGLNVVPLLLRIDGGRVPEAVMGPGVADEIREISK